MTVSGLLKFSTDDFPIRDRVAMWREFFCRAVVKMDLIKLGDGLFRSDSTIRVLPDLKIWSCSVTKTQLQRTPSLVAEGDDSLVLAIVRKGQALIEQDGQEMTFGSGDALLWSTEACGFYHSSDAMDILTLTIPRRSLACTVVDLDQMMMKPIPASTEALRLLVNYTEMLHQAPAIMAPDLLALSASHIHDLAALAMGATRDAKETAKNGGLRAARLQAVKSDIMANLCQPGLAVATIAARHGISPRYIRALFESEQTSFSDFVREQRLRRAYRIFCDPQSAGYSISSVAFDCGFGDLSYFNHSFRRRFGATPSDIRSAARQ